MPTCNGFILWHTVYLLAIVLKQILITPGIMYKYIALYDTSYRLCLDAVSESRNSSRFNTVLVFKQHVVT